MYRTTLALLAMFTAFATALAQTPNPYNGTWQVLMEGFERERVRGTATVKDDGGTWSITASDRKDACIGRDAPMTVQSSAEGIALKVNRSQVLAGCPDFTLKFKKIDEKTMKAELSGGRAVTLTRN